MEGVSKGGFNFARCRRCLNNRVAESKASVHMRKMTKPTLVNVDMSKWEKSEQRTEQYSGNKGISFKLYLTVVKYVYKI